MSKGYIYAGNVYKGIQNILISDDYNSRQKALKDGYNAFSIYSYSHEPNTRNELPIIKGDLWIEINGLDIYDIISCARDAITNLKRYFNNFTENSAAYFLNGTNCCQICIPVSVFCDTTGYEYLPLVHKDMVRSMSSEYVEYKIFNMAEYNTMINMSLYNMRYPYLLSNVGIQLPNGQYKVQITPQKFIDADINELIQLTLQPCNSEILIPSAPPTGMVDLFHRKRMKFIDFKSLHDRVESLTQCTFVDHCFNLLNSPDESVLKTFINSESFTIFLAMLAKLGDNGSKVIHKICKNINVLDDETINSLILKSRDCIISCGEVNKHFTCPAWCNVDCPFDLKAKENNDIINADTHFDLRDDGLYYKMSDNSGECWVRISSYICVEGKIRDTYGAGWGRLVTVRDPDSTEHKIQISMSDCACAGESVISKLCHLGLEITAQGYKKLILDYIRNCQKTITFTFTSKIGWQNDGVYLLPDHCYGLRENMKYHYESENSLFKTSGTHGEWVDHIGKLCIGNPMMEFVCQLALSGPLLRPLNIEGGGYHFHGPSSCGKTTLAQLAGSICGGDGRNGFIRQWRTTANALEKTATASNDNLLILDEIGQSDSGTVHSSMYMLFNERSKERMNPDTTLRKSETWRITCLSTGEESLKEKISNDSRYHYMAGQEVRFINIPVNNDDKIAFLNLHGFKTQGGLSDYIKTMTNQYYGTPLRKFLEFVDDKEHYISILKGVEKIMNRFVAESCPAEACSQVRRVARKFGLIAGAGCLACARGVFPWTTVEAYSCVQQIFAIWLQERGTLADLEVEGAIANLTEYINRYGLTHFREIKGQSYYNQTYIGVRFSIGNNTVYFFYTGKFHELTRGVNRIQLLNELKKRNMLYLTRDGNIFETKSVHGLNKRGYGIIIDNNMV